MKSCNYIMERIDQAENPDLLSFDITEHIGECQNCARFAAERSALRSLLSSGARVNAPLSFDAMLSARLAEVKSRSPFWWLGSIGYARLATASAGIVAMLFAAQYSGLFTTKQVVTTKESEKAVARVDSAPAPKVPPSVMSSAPAIAHPPTVVPAGVRVYPPVARARREALTVSGTVPSGYFAAEDGGVVLVRGRNGDVDVQVPSVSVGAQPLFYVSAGQRPVRNVGTSF
jgi:hypothetical protein